MGYGDGVKGFRIWSPAEKRVIMRRNVVFDESSLLRTIVKPTTTSETGSLDKQVEFQVIQSESDLKEPEKKDQESQTETDIPESMPSDIHQSISQDRPRRVEVRPPTRYDFEDMVGYALQVAQEVDTSEPSTYKEAILSPDSEKWFAAREMRWSPYTRIRHGIWSYSLREERLLLANGFSRRRKGYHQQKESSIKPGLLRFQPKRGSGLQ